MNSAGVDYRRLLKWEEADSGAGKESGPTGFLKD